MNVIQYTSATNGTIVANNTQQDLIVLHNTVSLIAALSFTLPTTPVNGQIVTFATRNGITLFTITGGTLLNNLAALVAGGNATWCYSLDANGWFRIR